MVQRYYTTLRQASSRLIRALSASSSATTYVQLFAEITSVLLLSGWFSLALAGQVTLAWNAPTTYTDGTPVTALAGYHFSLRDSAGGTQRVDIGNQTTYTLTGLTEGLTYTITVTAADTTPTGHESSMSNSITVPVPLAQPDTATTLVGTALPIAVLANDTDPTGQPLTITSVTQGAHGAVTITGTSVTYMPAATFVGTDSFTYTVTDGQGASTTATVMVNVLLSGNHPPSALADTVSIPVGTTVTIAVLANDTDPDGNPLTITAVTQGTHGTVTRQTTSVTYTPVATFVGTDSFTYTIADGQGASATATVTVTMLPDPAASLVAAYSFDEGSGTTVTDASGNNNTGTISGATWTTAGKFGGALVFDGTSAKVTIPDAPSLRLTTDMTLEAWVKPSTVTAAWRDVIYKGNDNYLLEGTAPNGGGVPAGGGTFGANFVATYGTAPLAVNTWTHLALTYNGATLRLYVNGVQVASQAQTGNLVTSANPLQIGGDSIFGQYFQGTIDEVRIYNQALSPSEIQADMQTPVVRPPAVPPPAAAYSFNEGSGTTASDSSGNGNTGTISAGPVWSAQGKFGSALAFTGSGNVIVPHAPTVNLTSSFTLSAWVKPTALSGYQTILIKETTGGCAYWLQTNGNQVSSGFNNGSGCTEHQTTTANLPLNAWSYLTAVFDDAASTYQIYVNGNLVSSQTETGKIQPNTQSLVFGQSGCSSCGFERWQGLIDEVRIYNRALSPSEIQADMGTPIQ